MLRLRGFGCNISKRPDEVAEPEPPPDAAPKTETREQSGRTSKIVNTLDSIEEELDQMSAVVQKAVQVTANGKNVPPGLRSQLAELHGTKQKSGLGWKLATRIDAVNTRGGLSPETSKSARMRRERLANAAERLIETMGEQIRAIDARESDVAEQSSRQSAAGEGSRRSWAAGGDIEREAAVRLGRVSEEAEFEPSTTRVSTHQSAGSRRDASLPPPAVKISLEELCLATGEQGLSEAEAAARLAQFGRNELPDMRVPKWKVFLSHFTGVMPATIVIAIVVESLLRAWADVATLAVLLLLNGLVGFWEDVRAGDAVAALKASLTPRASVKRDGTWRELDAPLLVPGDRVRVVPGASVPADCRVCDGAPHDAIQVDQAALTGESLPVRAAAGDAVPMGATVVTGDAQAIVTSTGVRTAFGRTAALVGATHDVGHIRVVLLRVTCALLLLSAALVALTVSYLCVRDAGQLWPAISFGVVLLVASIPIAMQVVCTATMALGSRELAAKGAVVARLSSIEQLAGMTVLCADKTGTLTLNKMALQHIEPYASELETADVLTLAALATRWREPPRDALDALVLGAPALDREALETYEQLAFSPFDPTRRRTEATLRGRDGRTFVAIKGAPHAVLALCHADNRTQIGERFASEVDDLARRGIRALAVARQYEGGAPCEMAGLLAFVDPPRHDSAQTVARVKALGVTLKMITGDHTAVARETARSLGLGERIEGPEPLPAATEPGAPLPPTLGRDCGALIEECDGFAQASPEHKFLVVEALRQRGHRVGMTGDGVNDAPALKKADVGIAVQGATDAARAAADLVLTAPGLSVIVDAIILSRAVVQRMKHYVIYRVACTVQLLLFFVAAVFAFDPRRYDARHAALPDHPHVYELPGAPPTPTEVATNKSYGFSMAPDEVGLDIPATFQLPVLALVVIVLLNDATILSVAYDRVTPSRRPVQWTLPVLFVVAVAIGLVALASSLLMLHMALMSEDPRSLIRTMPLLRVSEPLTYGQIVAMMYLKISLSDWWTIFAARTRGPFYSRAPSCAVFAAAALATALSTTLAVVWPFRADGFSWGTYLDGGEQPDGQLVGLGLSACVFTWTYTLVWFLVQDGVKVLLYCVLDRCDACGIRTEAEADREATAREENEEATAAKVKTPERSPTPCTKAPPSAGDGLGDADVLTAQV